jgi:nicotinamide-nucleotide amidase
MKTPKLLTAQIILIGDEILNGSISDANLAPLASWLLSRGIKLTQVTTVRDEREGLTKTIKQAWKASDLVITTGGLGPTKDDITKSVLGEITQGELKESSMATALVSAQYEKIGKEWKKETNLYHMIPDGVEVFKNPMGLAPGLKIKKEGKLLLATPGVPRELRAMINEEFDDLLKDSFPGLSLPDEKISIRTKGIPEERIFFELMPDLWSYLETFGKVSSLPQLLGVDIHIQIPSNESKRTKQAAQEEIQKKLADSPLSAHIWHWGHESIEEIVVEKASQTGLKIALAESCTGGLVAHRLTNVSGSSRVFIGSLVTYANEAKENLLQVQNETLLNHGAVSTQVATEMARGARIATSADIAISLTGIAGPTGGSEEKPVGTLCIGDSTKASDNAKRVNYFGDRDYLKKRFSQVAFFRLLEIIDTF